MARQYTQTSTINKKTDHSTHLRLGRDLCGAKKKNGDRCVAFAGWGTDHVGTGVCKNHGGAMRNHRIRAERIRAQQAMVQYGALTTNMQPGEALLWVVQATAGHAAWLGQRVAEQDGLTGNEARVLLQLYGEERDRLTRASKAALDSGIAERQVQLAERWGEMIAQVMSRVFDELRLTPPQRRRAPDVVRRVLLAAENGTRQPV
jgi:hypothetical protein